ncbi:MAG: zinc ribbon domain-containing protein [Prevotella sp.]|uniref:zinc ribbon domain-containing protein n=1 Tax=Prevotella sp. TaxID=59823 RepID=UPI002A29D1D0|nr:zinc ribbon domain-containing protein [Prevotella sp.]MDD7318206.1 zinc ribbon domain-containing protein [Prevotellaceae bacterium]MDY4020905.1 zinc ribbon domain-containing protein [Prevotella sp.]
MLNRVKLLLLVLLPLVLLSLCSCGNGVKARRDAIADTVMLTPKQIDSLVFEQEHHYSQNYNFVISKSSVTLLKQLPEEALIGMPVDSLTLMKGDHIVVADIRIIPHDTKDSVWLQVARDQLTFGWARESDILPVVVPDDPISKFISIFSDVHYVIFIVVIILISVAYIVRTSFRNNAKLVHFNDIPSFYPTLLTIIVSASASFYASIQNFVPDTWREFYFHPTLNPFIVEPWLSVFLVSVWTMLILWLACIDVVRHHLPFGDALLYLCGLSAVCAADYIIFSVSTLWYVGYFLLAAYIYFALSRYIRHARARYVCGNCGHIMYRKGHCPACGVLNE